jgi:hypothetical protein
MGQLYDKAIAKAKTEAARQTQSPGFEAQTRALWIDRTAAAQAMDEL